MTFADLAPLRFIVTPASGAPSGVVTVPLINAGAAVGAQEPEPAVPPKPKTVSAPPGASAITTKWKQPVCMTPNTKSIGTLAPFAIGAAKVTTGGATLEFKPPPSACAGGVSTVRLLEFNTRRSAVPAGCGKVVISTKRSRTREIGTPVLLTRRRRTV